MAAKILFLDIETAPILGYFWSLWKVNIGLEQIKKDWHILSWAAKWAGDKKVMYMDQRNAKDISDDSGILKAIWKLIDEADVIVSQNGKEFDIKKLNARFVLNGMQPPSSFRHIDTTEIARKKFGFTSNKLAYMTDKLNKKFKKEGHKKYPGFELWKECLARNKDAWKEMEKYNKYDVLALEELYYKLIPWDTSISLAVYNVDAPHACSCGSKKALLKWGFRYTNKSKTQRYKCSECGAEYRDSKNLFTTTQTKKLLTGS